MKKVRIGVLGAYRGTSMINYCKRADHAEVVAICDKSPASPQSNPPANPNLNHLNFHQHVHLSYITP